MVELSLVFDDQVNFAVRHKDRETLPRVKWSVHLLRLLDCVEVVPEHPKPALSSSHLDLNDVPDVSAGTGCGRVKLWIFVHLLIRVFFLIFVQLLQLHLLCIFYRLHDALIGLQDILCVFYWLSVHNLEVLAFFLDLNVRFEASEVLHVIFQCVIVLHAVYPIF